MSRKDIVLAGAGVPKSLVLMVLPLLVATEGLFLLTAFDELSGDRGCGNRLAFVAQEEWTRTSPRTSA